MTQTLPPQPRPTALAYVRSTLLAVWMFASALALGMVCLPLMLGPRRWAMIPIQTWAKGLFAVLPLIVGLRVEVRGRERLPSGALLIASKHQAMLDTLIAMTLTPWPCIVLKKELMWIPIFGWYAWKAGMIPIDRTAGGAAARQMVGAARKAIAEGRQVVIYPEGTRRPPGAPPAYKGGAGLLYSDLGAPCVPVATNSGLTWPAHGLLKRPGLAVFEILPAIEPGLPRRTLMARLEADIEARSTALLDEAYVPRRRTSRGR